jgi:hypothetical protein
VDDPGPELKRCSTCALWKPLDAFNKLSRAKDGRQWSCRACNAAWHAENKERHNALIHARRDRLRVANQERLFRYLDDHPCVDCGEDDILVLEFDHLRDKRAAVTQMPGSHEWSAIEAEIEKCDVVCANCHRRRTAMRAGTTRWRREGARPVEPGGPSKSELETFIGNRLKELVGVVGLEPTTNDLKDRSSAS